MRNHLDEDQLTLLYYSDATEEQREHAAHCEECGARFRTLTRLLDEVRNLPVPELGIDWDQRLWRRLAPGVTAALRRGTRRALPLWVLGTVLAGILAVAFIGGMYTQHRLSDRGGGFSPKARERVLLITMGDHFDRSQIVLAELMNAPDGKPLDISGEQRLAGTLLAENRLLRQTALRTGDRGNASVLDQLERLLMEIAHSPREISSAELKELQKRIEEEGLLLKVRVISTNTREKGMKL